MGLTFRWIENKKYKKISIVNKKMLIITETGAL